MAEKTRTTTFLADRSRANTVASNSRLSLFRLAPYPMATVEHPRRDHRPEAGDTRESILLAAGRDFAEHDYRIWNALAAYFERHVDLMQQEPYIAVTAAMLACAAQSHDRWAPDAPQKLTITAKGKDLVLAWQPPETDAGGGPLTGIQGYVVYRATSSEGPFKRVQEALVQTGHYVDVGAASHAFHYRVAAADYHRPANEGSPSSFAWKPDQR